MTAAENNFSDTQISGVHQARLLRTTSIIVGLLAGITGLGITLLAIMQSSWQLAVIASLFLLTAALWAASAFHFKGQSIGAVSITAISLALALLTTAALVPGLGIPVAVNYLVFSLILSSIFQNPRHANNAILLGILVAALCSILSEFSPFPQVDSSQIKIYIPAILGILFMIYVVLLTMQYVAATLRVRLVTIFLAIVILPLILLSFAQSRFMFSTLQEEKESSLRMAAMQVASRLDNYLDRSRDSIRRVSNLSIFAQFIELDPAARAQSPQESELRKTLNVVEIDELDNPVYRSSFAVLDENGMNIYDTFSDVSGMRLPSSIGSSDPFTKGKGAYEGDMEYFKIPFHTSSTYISPVYIQTQQNAFFYISSPIKNTKGETIGVLRMRNDGLLLQQLVREFNNLTGPNTYAILVDENNIRLADGFTPQYIFRSVASLPNSQVRDLQENYRLPNLPASMVTTQYDDFARALTKSSETPTFMIDIDPESGPQDYPEIGAIQSLNSMPWKVIFVEKDFDFAVLQKRESSLVTLVTTLIATVVGMIAVLSSHLLSRPIVRLTSVAQVIASGNLNVKAPADTPDEFGVLGKALNSMTNQVLKLIMELENRVKSRTQDIQKQNELLVVRANQFQTVSDVARQIVSLRELEPLLSSVTNLISERFGFYHVGIFLLDENKEYAILRAANSEGGKRMLARNHMLPVGRVGIVGNVTGIGEARIATDVGEDAVFFNNPDLPQTRSEMALPLRVGAEIIGAIDIQSTESNAFKKDDIELFTTLADQVAIAIYNNRLYSETARALAEAQLLHRQYLHEEWEREMSARGISGFAYNRLGVKPQKIDLTEWKSVIDTGQPLIDVTPQDNSTDRASMAVPITVRGETLGLIHVEDTGEDRSWSEDEIAVVNDVANQVAVALENARLFEATVRRAEREKKVLEITAMIRSTNEPDRMMQIAVNEIQRALGATRAQIYVRPNYQSAADSSSDSQDSYPHRNGGNGHNSGQKPGNL